MAEHIKDITITNFKSIKHQVISGCKRINVFIGYPNVGKSAILEAISGLAYLQEDFDDLYSELCRLKNVSELFFNGNSSESALVKLADVGEVEFSYVSEKQLSVVVEVNDEAHLNDISEDQYEASSYKQLNFIGDKIHRIQSRAKGDVIKVKKYQFQNVFNDYKTDASKLWFPYGQNLVDIVQSNRGLRKEVGELFKKYDLKLLIDQATNSIRGLRYLDEDTIFTIPFYQMAETLQRIIFHKAAISSNEDTVLLFEEPEAHMFPPYIRLFTSDVIYDEGNGNQYFISTHSPFVIGDFLDDAREDLAIFLVGYKNGETTIKRLSDEEMHEVYQYGVDLFYNIESYLD